MDEWVNRNKEAFQIGVEHSYALLEQWLRLSLADGFYVGADGRIRACAGVLRELPLWVADHDRLALPPGTASLVSLHCDGRIRQVGITTMTDNKEGTRKKVLEPVSDHLHVNLYFSSRGAAVAECSPAETQTSANRTHALPHLPRSLSGALQGLGGPNRL